MIIRGKSRKPSKSQQAFGRLSPAQRAAKEKAQTGYLSLACGHVTTREVKELYRVFSAIDVYCDKCDEWQPITKEVTRQVYDQLELDEPPF